MIQNVGGYRGLTQMQELNKYSHKQNNQLKAQQFPVSKEIFRINDLINEYEHFNASGRKNLLEIMAIAPMKITNKITSTYTKDGKSYTDVIYDPEQDTQEYPTKEEIIIRTKSKYGKELGYFEKEFDFLKKI